MRTVKTYLDDIKTKIITSEIINSVTIISAREISTDSGYFRARMILANGDFLELSEFFSVRAGQHSTIEYRYQWMDGSRKKLIKRWDNSEHFPKLMNFPHHIHIGAEERVLAGTSMGIIEAIDLITSELKSEHKGLNHAG